jgi:hypothetical protein
MRNVIILNKRVRKTYSKKSPIKEIKEITTTINTTHTEGTTVESFNNCCMVFTNSPTRDRLVADLPVVIRSISIVPVVGSTAACVMLMDFI